MFFYLDTTLSIPTIIWTMAAIGVAPTILWTLWVMKSRRETA